VAGSLAKRPVQAGTVTFKTHGKKEGKKKAETSSGNGSQEASCPTSSDRRSRDRFMGKGQGGKQRDEIFAEEINFPHIGKGTKVGTKGRGGKRNAGGGNSFNTVTKREAVVTKWRVESLERRRGACNKTTRRGGGKKKGKNYGAIVTGGAVSGGGEKTGFLRGEKVGLNRYAGCRKGGGRGEKSASYWGKCTAGECEATGATTKPLTVKKKGPGGGEALKPCGGEGETGWDAERARRSIGEGDPLSAP